MSRFGGFRQTDHVQKLQVKALQGGPGSHRPNEADGSLSALSVMGLIGVNPPSPLACTGTICTRRPGAGGACRDRVIHSGC